MKEMTQDQVSPDTGSVHIARDAEVSLRDQLTVLSPYFRTLQSEHSLSAYLASGYLGSPIKRLLYWEGKPTAHCLSFPFPFLIDGKQVIAGKPELGAVDGNVLYRFPKQFQRPDLFGMVINEVISEARDAKWPFLLTKPNTLARALFNRRGFRSVAMPFVETIWLLRPQAFVSWGVEYVCKRYRKLSKAIPKRVLNGAVRAALHAMNTVTTIRTASVPSVYELTELPLGDLSQHSQLLETNYWPHSRLTVWREPDFLQHRLQSTSKYKTLAIWSRRERKVIAVAIVCCGDDGVSLLDVLPPTVSLEKEFWAELIRFVHRAQAPALKVRLYLNNSFHAAIAQQSCITLGSRSVKGLDVYVALVLDRKWSCAYDPHSWAGTEMLYATF